MPVIRRRLVAATLRFANARRGVIAIEFAILAPLMLMILFVLVEVLISFMISTTLETATANAARDIRTGQFQTSQSAQPTLVQIGEFKKAVCGGMAWIGDCDDRLSVASRTFASFPILRNQLEIGLQPDSSCWQTGGARTIVLVTTRFRWQVFTPMLRPMLGETPDGKQTMNAMAVFQNEPFGPIQAAGALCP